MGLELLFLLLPLAALSGYWLGRKRNVTLYKHSGHSEIPSDYLKGLNFLLNEQPDKAIEIFIQLLEVNSDTVETHLALGSLFRRRGEVDRAIRIHQNLIARPTLNREQRAQALYDLGQDYMRAGLLDRAETLFTELIDTGPHTEHALWQLIDIYQTEKEWEKAIQTARRIEAKKNNDLSPIIAHYYCELADTAIKNGEIARGFKNLKKANMEDSNCVRISLIEGQTEKDSGNYKAAIRAFRRVEDQDQDFIPEIIEPLDTCYTAIGSSQEMQEYLQKIVAKTDGISAMLALAKMIHQQQGEEAEIEFITEHLKQRPSVRGMDKMIELNLNLSKEGVKEKLHVLKHVTEKLLQDKPRYLCSSCGFSAMTIHWHCPSCKNWNTIKPIQGVEGE